MWSSVLDHYGGKKWETSDTMFRGRHETIVDAKGRTSLPARFRDVLTASDDRRMVLTTGLEPCLVAYPYSAWNAFEERLASRPTFDPAVNQIKRLYVASAVECLVDSHGRILIPSTLREYASAARAAGTGSKPRK